MKKLFLIIGFFVFLFSITTKNVNADENSVISHDITYDVQENGSTHVSMSTGITNKLSGNYTASYTIDLGFDDIRNVKSSDGAGNIDPIISKSENGQKVQLDFNEKVVGINNTLRFKMAFDTNKVAVKQGNIWEVNIPGLAKQSDFSSFNVHVRVPASFGVATFIKPEKPLSNLNFTKEDLGNSGIFITFGSGGQIYNFDLKYHIKNSNLFPVKTEIALPPTTNYQDVYIQEINPEPLNVTKDKDGNWLAQYYLMPSEKKDITALGQARVFLNPKRQEMTEADLSEYLKEKTYWETTNPKIKDLASRLKTPKEIYDYVVKSLSYDLKRLNSDKPRIGAVGVLGNPSFAVCTEFTDLFIAIARSAGIPAREVDGFANTENSKQRPLSLVRDILHSWPEYYDKQQQTWVMVDPTWGNTTGGVDYFNILDFDHFAFVVKGVESEYPVPAGGYKVSGQESLKDVNVNMGGNYIDSNPSVDLTIDLSDKLFSGLPINGYATLKNNSGVVFPSQVLSIKSDKLYPKMRRVTLDEIPPFGYLKLPINFEKMPILSNTKSKLEFTIGDKTIDKNVEISPLFLKDWRIIGGVLIAIFTITIFIVAARARGLFVSKPEK